MKEGLRVVAVVPARGGTDTVPYLNIKRLGDRPLLAHTLDAARGAPSIDRVVVSTDDPGVAAVARAHGADVPFLRPTHLARDLPSLKPVIVHAVTALEEAGDRIDLVVLLQATTPFRKADAIEKAIDKLLAGGFDSVLSVTEDRTLNWREQDGRLVPLFVREGRREEQDPIYRENGAVVVLRRAVLDGPSRLGEHVGHVVLDKRAGFTVYDLTDFWMAERLLQESRVLFRTDGGEELGMGHVYRCLAIADVLRANMRADIAFLMTRAHPAGIRTVEEHGYDVVAADAATVDLALAAIRAAAPDILINDLPDLDPAYLRELARLPTTTVNLVDETDALEATEEAEHLIVSLMKEERETPEGFFGGPEYAILRAHFGGVVKEVRARPERVLLSFGGSDPQGLTLKAARALASLPAGVEVVAAAGPAFSHRRDFEALAAALSRRVPLIDQAGGHIADLMLAADVVVCSGGMSVYELAALGTPGIVLAQNEREHRRMQEFSRHGTIQYLGMGTEVGEPEIAEAVASLLADQGRRRTMSARGHELVDGQGAIRAADAVLAHHRRQREAVGNGGRR